MLTIDMEFLQILALGVFDEGFYETPERVRSLLSSVIFCQS